MSGARAKALVLIAVASGLLAFEAVVLMGAAAAMGGVCQRSTHRRLRVIQTTQEARRARVWAVSVSRDREVRKAVEEALRKAAL